MNSRPLAVSDLAEAGRGPFVLFAGAGISLWHPSPLPTWGEFNQVLLDEAKARAARALRSGSDTAQALDALTVDNVAVAL